MNYQEKAGEILLGKDVHAELVHVVLKEDALELYKRNAGASKPQRGAAIQFEKERRVLLRRGNRGYGMTISGGTDTDCPLVIENIQPGMPAAQSNLVERGDYIISINGHSVQDKTHAETVQLLAESGQTAILRVAKRKQSDTGTSDDEIDQNEEKWIKFDEVQLTLASITKYKAGSSNKREDSFELYYTTVDGHVASFCFYFGDDFVKMQEWWEALYQNITLQNQRETQKLNSEQLPEEEKIMCIGIVHEQVQANNVWSTWQRKFLALRRHHIEFFPVIPNSVREWMRPEKRYSVTEISVQILKQTRDLRSACIKLIAGIGESHIISFEHHDDIVLWTNSIQVATSLTIKQYKSTSFPAIWKKQSVNFIIDYDHGFKLQQESDGSTIWCQPFSKLKKTHDNGRFKLKLIFRGAKTDIVEELEIKDLHVAVCVIQAFLVTRVMDIDAQLIVETGFVTA